MKTEKELIEEFDGSFETFYEVGLIKEKGLFKNGLLSGAYLKYDENGWLEKELRYIEGDLHGICKEYAEGMLLKKRKYKNGIENVYYNEKNGSFKVDNLDQYFICSRDKRSLSQTYRVIKLKQNKTYQALYSDSNLKEQFENNCYTSYWRNGNLKSKEFYVNAEKQGISETYFSNGVLKSRCFYITGVLEGSYDRYYYDGRICQRDNYRQGLLHGISKGFYNNGQLKSKSSYINGEENSSKLYNEDGTISCKNRTSYKINPHFGEHITYPKQISDSKSISYENGVVVSKSKSKGSGFSYNEEYFENGQIKYKEFQGDDEMVTCFDDINRHSYSKHRSFDDAYDNIKPIEAGIIHLHKGKEGVFRKYYKNGNLKDKGTYLNDLLEGHYIGYYKNGGKKKSTYYIRNIIDGQYFTYYKNGIISTEFNYKLGILNGVFKKYYYDGKLCESGVYYQGFPVGLIEKYTKCGKISAEPHFDKKGELIENKTLSELYYYNGNIAEKTYLPQYSMDVFDRENNSLSETYYENGLLKSKIGLPSKKDIDFMIKQDNDEYEQERAADEYHRTQEYEFYDSEDAVCGACQELPCMCSDPYS